MADEKKRCCTEKVGDVSWMHIDGKMQKVVCIGAGSGTLVIPNAVDKWKKAARDTMEQATASETRSILKYAKISDMAYAPSKGI